MASTQQRQDEWRRDLTKTTDVGFRLMDEAMLTESDVWQDIDLLAVAEDREATISLQEMAEVVRAAKAGIRTGGKRSNNEEATNVSTAVDRALMNATNSGAFQSAFGVLSDDTKDLTGRIWGEIGLGGHRETFSVDDVQAVNEVATRVVQALVQEWTAAMAEHAAAEQEQALRDLKHALSKARAYGASREDVETVVEQTLDETRTVPPYAWVTDEDA
jgi:hypothetical protein